MKHAFALRLLATLAVAFPLSAPSARGQAPATAASPAPLFVESDGAKIHYVVQGEGEPVLLIHGFSASIQLQWKAPGVFDALASEYKVIAYDNRGHGRSDKPHDPEQYGDKMVEDAIAVLDHLGIEKAHVVGYSMGAFITANLIARHSDRLLSATLGGAGWPKADPANDAMLLELAESLEKDGSFAPLFRRLTPADRPAMTDEQIAGMSRMAGMMNDTKALAASIRGFKELQVTEAELRAVDLPVQAVVGTKDPLLDTVTPLEGVLPGVEVVLVEDADHMTAFGRPEFLAALRAFLAENGAAVAAGN